MECKVTPVTGFAHWPPAVQSYLLCAGSYGPVGLAVVGFGARIGTPSGYHAERLQDISHSANNGSGGCPDPGHEEPHNGGILRLDPAPSVETNDDPEPNREAASRTETEADPGSFHLRLA
jgi:hypothetical protein